MPKMSCLIPGSTRNPNQGLVLWIGTLVGHEYRFYIIHLFSFPPGPWSTGMTRGCILDWVPASAGMITRCFL